MNFFAPILADALVARAGVVGVWSALTDEARTRLFTVTAYALVIVAILAWAIFVRKQKNKRRRIHKHHPHTWQQSEEPEKRRHRHRHRRTRPADRPQNPSLADAGGLPPRRPDDVPPRGT